MSEILNLYWLPPPPSASDVDAVLALAPFDINFCFPIKDLQSDKVKVVPFVVCSQSDTTAIHSFLAENSVAASKIYHIETSEHPELFEYMPYGPFSTISEAATIFELKSRRHTGSVWLAILDKTRPGLVNLPGTIGLLNSSP